MNNTDTRTTSLSGILIVNFENISLFLVFQLLILSLYLLIGTEREIQNKMGWCTLSVCTFRFLDNVRSSVGTVYEMVMLAMIRGVFRTLSNIYDGGLFRTIVNLKKPLVFFQKSPVKDISKGPKYLSVCRELIDLTRKSHIKFFSERYLSAEITLLHERLVLCIIFNEVYVEPTQRYIIHT